MMPNPKTVLFLCTGNSCRSQMAEGWGRSLRGSECRWVSAGVETHGLNPNAVAVMAEAGVDITPQVSQHLQEFDLEEVDLIVTVCDHARAACPILPKEVLVHHHPFPDPPAQARDLDGEEALECYRRVRDEIKGFVSHLDLSTFSN